MIPTLSDRPELRLRFFSVRKFLLLVLILSGWLFLTPNPLSATDSTYVGSYLISYPQTTLKAAKAPLQWTDRDWHTAAGIVFVGGSLYLFDEELHDLIRRNRSPVTEAVATGAKQFGEGKYMLPALAVTWLGGYAFGSDKTQDTALLALKSFLLANGASLTLKYATQRHRPVSGQGKQFWSSSGFSTKRESFPSGHTTVAWSVAPILAHQYGSVKWVPPAAYSVATLTALSRIHDNRHWPSDVFYGAVIGYVTSQLVLNSTPRLQVLPSIRLTGLQFNYTF